MREVCTIRGRNKKYITILVGNPREHRKLFENNIKMDH
jgi:hypothetical protein